MPTYAADTSVSVEKSRAEIERTLQRYGADQFMYGWDADRAIIGFRASGRQVKFVLVLPARNEQRFHQTATGRARSATQALAEWEQACRQRWRALNLVIKAKLEAVEAEITTFDDEFMAHLVLPNGSTVGDWLAPQIERAYATAEMPALLPGGN